jgi:hypothetical protein
MAASRDRLRPILMITISFVAGMIPLAVSRGVGAETNRAMSSVIIGGQLLSLVLTLIAIPVIYSVFDDLAALRLISRMRRMAGALAAWAVQVLLPRRAPEPSPETLMESPATDHERGVDEPAVGVAARSPHGQAAVDDERLPGDVTRPR